MCISQKFLGDLCFGSPSCPDAGFPNAGALQLTQPLVPLSFDEKQMLCSFSLCFGLCVFILSKAHRNLMLHFSGFTSDDTFSVTAATRFYGTNFESQPLSLVIKVWLWAGQ